MGQRYVELPFTYTGDPRNATATLHVSQLPPNPAIIAPGPALIFVVVNGVPSVGVKVMLGSGQLGPQQILDVQALPVATVVVPSSVSTSKPSASRATRRSVCLSSVIFGFITIMTLRICAF